MFGASAQSFCHLNVQCATLVGSRSDEFTGGMEALFFGDAECLSLGVLRVNGGIVSSNSIVFFNLVLAWSY